MLSNWDKRYLELTEKISQWSKDPSSKIGCIAIGSKGQVLAQGYNGFPRGIKDTKERYNDRATKYKYVVHAEQNVIYNATYNGISLNGSTMYVTGLPCCAECAKGIIQVGVKRVVVKAAVTEAWKESCELTEKLFKEAKIKYQIIDPSDA